MYFLESLSIELTRRYNTLFGRLIYRFVMKTNSSNSSISVADPNVCLTEECVRTGRNSISHVTFYKFSNTNNKLLSQYPFKKKPTAASLLSAMDRTAAPCVDFFQYACGTWNKLHVIPEDRSSVSTFEVLADQLQVILKGLLEEPPDFKDSNATLKAKLFYKSCMDIRGYNESITEIRRRTLLFFFYNILFVPGKRKTCLFFSHNVIFLDYPIGET